MTEKQFLLWRELLESRTGIFITQQRQSYLQSSLKQRMRELDYTDYQSYYDYVVRGPLGKIEWARLIDRLTVQETRFFRDQAAFEFVEKFIATRPEKFSKKHPLDIWSVGCSSGEEVYSLAILAQEALNRRQKDASCMVTGTDISIPVLNKARLGVYSKRRIESLNTYYKNNYFSELASGEFELISEIKHKTCFAQVNVLKLSDMASTQRHIIYCQNLLIFFRRWRRQEILNHLVDRLVPGGLLLIGMGEAVDWHHPDIEPVKGERVSAFIKCAKNKNN